MGPSSADFPRILKGGRLEVDQQEHESVPKWDAGSEGGDFIYYVTMLGSNVPFDSFTQRDDESSDIAKHL